MGLGLPDGGHLTHGYYVCFLLFDTHFESFGGAITCSR